MQMGVVVFIIERWQQFDDADRNKIEVNNVLATIACKPCPAKAISADKEY